MGRIRDHISHLAEFRFSTDGPTCSFTCIRLRINRLKPLRGRKKKNTCESYSLVAVAIRLVVVQPAALGFPELAGQCVGVNRLTLQLGQEKQQQVQPWKLVTMEEMQLKQTALH